MCYNNSCGDFYMKLYIKTRNKFLILSIIILLVAFITIFIFKNAVLGNFLLGVFASTIIIAVQSSIAYKVEESKILIEKLKKMRDICFSFESFGTFSIEYYKLNFEEKYQEYKSKLELLFLLNKELGHISDLTYNTKKNIKDINDSILELELNLHIIFKNFNEQTFKYKVLYFMEFYNILKDFDFKVINNNISNLGWKIDSNEFYKSDYEEKIKSEKNNIEYKTSIQVYNKKIEENNSIEYKALKDEFKKYERINKELKKYDDNH